MGQLNLASITDYSKQLLIEKVVFCNRYVTFQDQAWFLDCWIIKILASSRWFMGKVWYACENTSLYYSNHLHLLHDEFFNSSSF